MFGATSHRRYVLAFLLVVGGLAVALVLGFAGPRSTPGAAAAPSSGATPGAASPPSSASTASSARESTPSPFRSAPPPAALGSVVSATPRLPAGGAVKGMTVSCPTWGWEWGSDAMVETMRELAAMGVNWVAIHPYARIGNDGTVSWRDVDVSAPPDWLARPIAEGHALGVKILVKPHLAYWGSRFSWRGDITFADRAAWDRFFTTYAAWIEQLAAASAGADAFVVGTELDATIQHEAEWREIVRRVRDVYDGPLTFASNWTDFRRVPFWDAVDAIGVQAYFPLHSGRSPTDADLDAGWAKVMEDVTALSAEVGRPVVFTELGYNRSLSAARQPWEYSTDGTPEAAALQARCLDAALRAIDAEPDVVGAFLWKWFPGTARPRDFDASAPAMREVIERRWGAL